MKDNFQTKKRDEQSHLRLCSIVVVGMGIVGVRLGGSCGVEDGWWWWRNESNVNRDAVDVALKLRSPTKIMFDTDTYYPDNKIKI